MIGFELTVRRSSTSAGPDTGQESNPLGDLEKLPAEIRIEIYKHALITEEPFRVTRSRHENRTCKHYRCCVPIAHSARFCLVITTLVIPKRRQKVRMPAGSAISAALLRASNAIQKEAISILYHENCFQFDTTRALYDFFRTLPRNAPLMASAKFNMVFKHPEDLDVLGNIEKPKQLVISPVLRDTADAFRVQQLDVERAVTALKPCIQRMCARPGSSSGRQQIACRETQLKRLEAIHFDFTNSTKWLNGANAEKSDMHKKKEQEQVAEFREAMAQEIDKDASEAAKEETN